MEISTFSIKRVFNFICKKLRLFENQLYYSVKISTKYVIFYYFNENGYLIFLTV